MAKRFTDSRKYFDPWFRKLTPIMKLCWDYMLHMCDHAGIYKCDFEHMSFCIGSKIDEKTFFSAFLGKIKVLKNNKIFIPKFIEFQYGSLNEGNRVHNSVIEILKKEGAYKGLKRPLQGCKDKDKDKDKNKDKDKDKEYKAEACRVIDWLNEKAGRSFEYISAHNDIIIPKLKILSKNMDLEKAGYLMRQVVSLKLQDKHFLENPHFFSPMTLYGRKKFWEYIEEVKTYEK